MSENEGADDYDGSVIDVDALEAAEAEAEAAKGEKAEEAEVEVEAESPPAVEDNDEEKTEEDDKPKAKKSRDERIDELTKLRRRAERAAEAAEARERELQQKFDELQKAVPPEPKKTLADFNFDETAFQEYIREDAIADARKVAREEAEKVNREFISGREAEETQSDYEKREAEFAKTVDDFRDKTYTEETRISESMAQVIREVDVGPELFYYFGNNRDEAEYIAGLSPATAGMEMAAIVTKLRGAKAEAQKKEVSKAPPPPAKIAGVDASLKKVSTDDPRSDKLSDDEWFKREELRLAKLRG